MIILMEGHGHGAAAVIARTHGMGRRWSRRGSRSGCASCARPRPVVRRMLKGFERLKRPRLLPVRMVRPWRRRGRLRNSI